MKYQQQSFFFFENFISFFKFNGLLTFFSDGLHTWAIIFSKSLKISCTFYPVLELALKILILLLLYYSKTASLIVLGRSFFVPTIIFMASGEASSTKAINSFNSTRVCCLVTSYTKTTAWQSLK